MDRKPIVCDQCFLVFETTEQFEVHRGLHQSGGSNIAQANKCEHCQKSFKTETLKDEHMLMCQKEELFACNVCFQVFTDEKLCNDHSAQHIDTKPFLCDVCNQGFQVENDFKDHMLIAHGKLTTVNSVVQNVKAGGENATEAFPEEDLAFHMTANYNTSNNEYTCDRCYKTFRKRKSLKKHRKFNCVSVDTNAQSFIPTMDQIFSGDAVISLDEVSATDIGLLDGIPQNEGQDVADEKSFACDECKQTFSRELEYVAHMITHAVHKCTTCNMMFSSELQLGQHIDEMHKYACNHCPKRFGRRGDLLSHAKTHSMEKTFKCTCCDKLFYNKFQLDMHVFKSHSKNAKSNTCEKCNEKFATKSDLNRHMSCHALINPYKCPMCSLSFATSAALEGHSRIHDDANNRLHCSYCSKPFSKKSLLREHELTHYDEKPHKCAHCQESFVTMYKLQQHEVQTGHLRMAVAKKFDALTSRTSCFCHQCKRVFQSKNDYLTHVRKDHKMHFSTLASKMTNSHTSLDEDILSVSDGLFVGRENDDIESAKRPNLNDSCTSEEMSVETPAITGERNDLSPVPKSHEKIASEKMHKAEKIATENLIWCTTCFLLFDSKDLLNKHTTRYPDNHRAPAEEYRFICHECNMVFSGKKQFWDHISAHRDDDVDTSGSSSEMEGNGFDYISSDAGSLRSSQVPTQMEKSDLATSHMKQEKHSDYDDYNNVGNQNGRLVLGMMEIKRESKDDTTRFQCNLCHASFKRKEQIMEHNLKHHDYKMNRSVVILEKLNTDEICYSSESRKREKRLKTESESSEMCSEKSSPKLQENTHLGPTFPHAENLMPFSDQVFSNNGNTVKDTDFLSVDGANQKTRIGAMGGKGFACEQCKLTFSRESEYIAHVITHSVLIKCGLCNTMFSSMQERNVHIDNVHKLQKQPEIQKMEEMPDIPLKIKLEPQDVTSPKMENRMKDPKKSFKCDQCDKTFTSEYFKNRHFLQNHSAKKCNKCGQMFANARELNLHILTAHTKVDNEELSSDLYTCCYCHQRFTTKEAQLDHQLSHYDDKPHKCTQCDESFVSKYKLNQHQLLH